MPVDGCDSRIACGLPAHLAHALEDDGAVAIHALRTAAARRRKDGGEARCLVAADGARGDAVVGAADGLCAVDAGTPLDEVEIELEDALLAEDKLGDGDERGLRTFAEDGAAGAEEEIFDKLLGERGGAADALAFHVALGGELHLVPVEAVVLVEAPVFSGDDGVLEAGRDLAEREVGFARVIGLVLEPGLEAALDVDGGGGRVDPTEGDEEQRGQQPERSQNDGEPEKRDADGELAERGGECRAGGHSSGYAGAGRAGPTFSQWWQGEGLRHPRSQRRDLGTRHRASLESRSNSASQARQSRASHRGPSFRRRTKARSPWSRVP